jgi:4-diphosphocytidyl-2C-methyl-D-erythritol kinase
MRLRCPAKINLHLRVGRRRGSDGFHPLLTWMTTVGLFDTLTVEALPPDPGAAPKDLPPPGRERAGTARAGASGILRLSSDLRGLPGDERNLVVRAADAFATAIAHHAGRGYGHEVRADDTTAAASRGAAMAARASDGVGERVGAVGPGAAGRPPARADGEVARVRPVGASPACDAPVRATPVCVTPVGATLEKRIPLGAGLGGGSSDAARTLQGLNALWRADWPAERLAAVAAGLGSDVPFFLHGPSSVCTGRGEIVDPVPPPRLARWAVLALPGIHMPTPDVYRRFDEMDLGFDDMIERPPPWRDWASRPAEQLLPGLVNDLERPAFDLRPDLGALRRQLELAAGRPVRLSGSGSSLFTLFDDEGAARDAAAAIGARTGVRAIAAELAPDLRDDLNAIFAPA